MRGTRGAIKFHRVFRVGGIEHIAVGKPDLLRRYVQALTGDPRQLFLDLLRRLEACDRGGGGKARGVIPRRDRPGVLCGVEIQIDLDDLRRQAKFIGDNLRQNGLMALSLRDRISRHADGPKRVDGDGGVGRRAALRVPLPFLMREDIRQIAHIGLGGLDNHGIADSVELTLRPHLIPVLFQLLQLAVLDAELHGLRIVAGIEQCARRRAIRKHARRHQILADNVQRIESELHRYLMHDALNGVIHLRAAEAAHHRGRAFIGQNHPVPDRHVLDVVSAGQNTMHAVERAGHRGPQERAVIVELVEAEPGDRAVRLAGGFQFDHPVGRGGRRRQMLQPVLDPFYGPPDAFRGQANQHDIWENLDFHAEPAARPLRHAHTKLRIAHAQCHRHHRVRGKRPLIVRRDIIKVLARNIFGVDHKPFDRGLRITRIADFDLYGLVGFGKGLVRFAIGKFTGGNDIAARRLMDHRRIIMRGLFLVDGRFQRLVIDIDQRQRVFGNIAVARDDDGDRLADIAHLFDRQGPLVDRRAQHDQEGFRHFPDVFARHYVEHAGMRLGLGHVDRQDFGMGMRRAQYRGVRGAGPRRQMV